MSSHLFPRNTSALVQGISLCVLVALLMMPGLDSSRAAGIVHKDDPRARGNQEARVVLLEYSDFTCGYCRKFFQETWPRLKAKYVDSGKMRFVYRDYPRADQGPGVDAAIAARCAGDQGRYWDMHDLLFSGTRALHREVFDSHARAIELNMTLFSKCLQEERHRDSIFLDREEAYGFGFRGTPGFVLLRMKDGEVDKNGDPPIGLPGAFPFEVFEEQIDQLLLDSSPRGKG